MRIDRDSLYTLGEAAELLGLSLRTLQRALARGELPTRKLGGTRFVRGVDLLDALPIGGEPKPRRKRKDSVT
jgi:excisionase family DNA binding protein